MIRTANETLLAVLLVLVTVSCAGFEARAPATCTPNFPYADGWLGADAAYSIPLGGTRSVWLFGDTFVGEPGQLNRRGSQFIHNSIAVSQCTRDHGWEIEYAWATDPDGKARAFVDSGEEGAYWWLFDGFVFEKRLYIGLLGVEKSEPRGPWNLPFRYTEMKLARVENYREKPGSWKIEILPLTDSGLAFPGAMVVEGEHVYLFAFVDRGAGEYPRILARFPLSALARGAHGEAIEYFAQDRHWRPGFDPDDALVLMEDDASEMSVRYHDGLGEWLAVYSFPTSEEVIVRTANALEGPWSEPRAVFTVPELSEQHSAGYDPNTRCYAAKEHPEYARDGELLFTYVCNLFAAVGDDQWAVLSRLTNAMYLYQPRVVSIPLSKVAPVLAPSASD